MRLSGGAAQGAGQLPARPQQGRRHPPAQLDPRPDGRARLGRAAPRRARRWREDLVGPARRSAPSITTPTISSKRCAAARDRRRSGRRSTRAATTCAPPSIPGCRPPRAMALMNGLETYDRRHGWRGAWGHVDDRAGLAEGGRWRTRRPPSGATWRAARGRVGRAARSRCSWPTDGRGRHRRRRRCRLGAGGQGAEGRRPGLRRAGRQRRPSTCARSRR